jgi:hypothetical protein
VIYLLMGDLWNREDLSLDGYLNSILRGQTSFTLSDEESVQASFERIVASIGGADFARQLKAEGSLSTLLTSDLKSSSRDEDDSVWGTVFTPRSIDDSFDVPREHLLSKATPRGSAPARPAAIPHLQIDSGGSYSSSTSTTITSARDATSTTSLRKRQQGFGKSGGVVDGDDVSPRCFDD